MRSAFLILLAVATLAQPARADVCLSMKSGETKLNLELEVIDPEYDHSKSTQYLVRYKKDMIDEWGGTNKLKLNWIIDDLGVAGLSVGGMGSRLDTKMTLKEVDPFESAHCTYVDEMTVTAFYRTMVFMPSQYPKDSCEYDVVKEHQLKHHAALKQAVDISVAEMKKELPGILKTLETGHVPKDGVMKKYGDMRHGLVDFLDIYLRTSVAKEMGRLSALLDTPQGDKLIADALAGCKGAAAAPAPAESKIPAWTPEDPTVVKPAPAASAP